MQVEVRLDPVYDEPKVIILTAGMSDEITALVNQLTNAAPSPLTGVRDEKLILLDERDIIRVYAQDGKVFATTAKGDFALKQRLYEMEERLDRRVFVRISNGEIINLRKAKGFDLKLTGTICVSLEGGVTTYVSRRYVAKIKQVLGV
ncbi:MAG: LytTR family transcriptional regulator [Clostridia bacterium]|nr:LytTR family transcriptional regulator [Clostridia bacterium]